MKVSKRFIMLVIASFTQTTHYSTVCNPITTFHISSFKPDFVCGTLLLTLSLSAPNVQFNSDCKGS